MEKNRMIRDIFGSCDPLCLKGLTHHAGFKESFLIAEDCFLFIDQCFDAHIIACACLTSEFQTGFCEVIRICGINNLREVFVCADFRGEYRRYILTHFFHMECECRFFKIIADRISDSVDTQMPDSHIILLLLCGSGFPHSDSGNL